MSLKITGVSAEYAAGTAMATRALCEVSLELGLGQLAVVLGPTGSGKTTLLRAASGLLELSAGCIEVDGRPVSGPGSVRGAVGLVFQRPEAQFFALSVEEDCAFGPRNLGASAEAALADARAALAEVGLDPDVFGEREPWSLSGGEARRAALAGVLAMRPRYLLMDEPTAGLDAAGRASVLDAVEGARSSAGVLIVTHDPELFLSRADHVLVLRGGEPVFDGDVPALLVELPALTAAGLLEAPEVPGAMLMAARRGLRIDVPLSLDPAVAADALARACGEGGIAS